jgi:hypothetical protein
MLPPWTFPEGLASEGSMNWLMLMEDSETRLGDGVVISIVTWHRGHGAALMAQG